MDEGQSRFNDFILARVRDDCKDATRELMASNFKKQSEGSFTREDMIAAQQSLMRMLKPEAVEEVKTAMAHFASQQQGK